MIIDCPWCKKKFNVKDELIPAKGRLLQCGECDREWFYSKNINTINETNVEVPDEEIAQKSFGIIEDKYDDDDVFEEDKTVELEKPKTIKKQKTKNVNFFKLLLVFIISFVAFILIVDTFLIQISEYVPFAAKYLDNLYQSVIDISLFFRNLIK